MLAAFILLSSVLLVAADGHLAAVSFLLCAPGEREKGRDRDRERQRETDRDRQKER